MKKNLPLLFITLVFIGILIEIICRVTEFHISYGERSSSGGYASPFETRCKWGYGWDETPKPFTMQDCNKLEFHYKWISNNEGLRGDNIALQKTGKRIMVFGDSFTEGMGAPNDSTYPELLENLIHQSLDSTAEVINCGPSGSDIFTEYKLFAGKMLKYQPDFVLVTFNSTDLYEFTVRGGFERFKPNNKVEYRKPPWFEPLYAKSYLVRFLAHDIFRYDYRFLPLWDSETMDSLSLSENCQAIDSFSLLCKANHCQFGMVFHPLPIEYPIEKYQNEPVIAYCKKNNIPYMDVYECFTKNGIKKMTPEMYWPKDGHFNSTGYELMAHCAFELFTNQGWLMNINEDVSTTKTEME